MKTVKMRWGYNMPGKKGQHIPGHSYKYKEGLFTKQEAERDARVKLLEKFPNVTNVLVTSDGCFGDNIKSLYHAIAIGEIPDESSGEIEETDSETSEVTKQEYTKQLVVYSNSGEYNHMFKAFEVALRESTRLAKQYNLEIDYMDSTVDDYIDPNDAIEPDEHTIVIKTGINIDTAPSYYGIKIVFRKSN